MLDWIILRAMAHYLPPEAMALICLSLTAWVVFENWLAKTGRSGELHARPHHEGMDRPHCSKPERDGEQEWRNHGWTGSRYSLPGSTGEPYAAAGITGGRVGSEDAGGVGGQGGGRHTCQFLSYAATTPAGVFNASRVYASFLGHDMDEDGKNFQRDRDILRAFPEAVRDAGGACGAGCGRAGGRGPGRFRDAGGRESRRRPLHRSRTT